MVYLEFVECIHLCVSFPNSSFIQGSSGVRLSFQMPWKSIAFFPDICKYNSYTKHVVKEKIMLYFQKNLNVMKAYEK